MVNRVASIPNESIGADYASVFAEFSSTLSVEKIPTEAIAAAKTNLFDTLACATAGISAVGVKDMVRLVADWGGKPEASIWCTDECVPAHHAAWINGMMAHARDYDDTHDEAVLHAGVSVVPAAIAAAELNGQATGADLIAGIAAGLELICRLGTATTIGIIESGFIYTSLFGHFAATAAAARVMGFDKEQTINALGIAYSQAAGTHQVTRDAALTKRIQPGFAAKTALISIAMTRIGIRGVRNTFEGADGLFHTYLRDRYDSTVLRDALGKRFEFVNLSYKPYPCCRFNHTAIDAALEIRKRLNGDVSRIRSISARVNKQAYEAVCTPVAMRQSPETIVQAQFSIPYTVACALTKGSVGLSDFTEAALRDPAIRQLAARVDAKVDDEIEASWSRNVSPTHLLVEADTGIFEARVDTPRGHVQSPMSKDDFERKLAGCLEISGAQWPTDTTARLSSAIEHIGSAARGGDLIAAIIPNGRSRVARSVGSSTGSASNDVNSKLASERRGASIP
jgi:2-methylcitrate dehydratase PrpD